MVAERLPECCVVVLIDCSLIRMEVETFEKPAHAKELHREEDLVDDVE